MKHIDQPSWRKPVGTLGILAYMTIWAVLVASLSTWVSARPVLVQSIFYLIAGIVWIFPLRPILKWMETGSFR
ncbi:MAG: DUF2842 domain-containing protein [Sphingomonadaceae bacterium]|jgi:hypothetical protein